ncbi:hypothetical protein FRC01_003018 [Tulasnella sp. 417]|nr:hypothetical protein FRC01_003018 [Tulasnella sp. 417]
MDPATTAPDAPAKELTVRPAAPADESPKVKPHPKSGEIPLEFTYFPSDDGTDENLLILLHGLGDTHVPFAKLGKSLKLPQTATLALRAPEHGPMLNQIVFVFISSLSFVHFGKDTVSGRTSIPVVPLVRPSRGVSAKSGPDLGRGCAGQDAGVPDRPMLLVGEPNPSFRVRPRRNGSGGDRPALVVAAPKHKSIFQGVTRDYRVDLWTTLVLSDDSQQSSDPGFGISPATNGKLWFASHYVSRV